MPRSEKETRLKLIDPTLRRAGWEILTNKYIIEKSKACVETPVVGMPTTDGHLTRDGFVDYVLFGDDGKPLALIEAKKSLVNEEQGKVQACLYADCLRALPHQRRGFSIRLVQAVSEKGMSGRGQDA